MSDEFRKFNKKLLGNQDNQMESLSLDAHEDFVEATSPHHRRLKIDLTPYTDDVPDSRMQEKTA